MNNITVYAENSFELQASNQNLSSWCGDKIKALEAEATEISDTLVCAMNFGTNTKNIKSALNNIQRKIRYYQKLKKAIELGYTIIPNSFWQEAIAVRVKENGAPKYINATDNNLPVGEGKYVDDKCFTETETWKEGDKEKKRTYPVGYDDSIDFPLMACKTRLIDAANKAMQFLVFDEIAVTRRSSDPMIIGRIRRPDGQFVDFLIAWWLDTNSL